MLEDQSARAIELLAIRMEAAIAALQADMKRVLVVIEERQLETQMAVMTQRLNQVEKSDAEQRAELQAAKQQMINYLVRWLIAVVAFIAVTALGVLFKLK